MIYVYVYDIYRYRYMYAYINTYTRIYVYAYIRVIHTYIQMYEFCGTDTARLNATHRFFFLDIYTYTHIYTYIHIHTYIQMHEFCGTDIARLNATHRFFFFLDILSNFPCDPFREDSSGAFCILQQIVVFFFLCSVIFLYFSSFLSCATCIRSPSFSLHFFTDSFTLFALSSSTSPPVARVPLKKGKRKKGKRTRKKLSSTSLPVA